MNYDYIVIGAGSAGCALVHELERSGRKESVLVLEAGGSDWSPYIKVPLWQPRASLAHDWGYRSQPDPSRGGASERWKRGRVLGGSSSVNGMIYVRGAAQDFDRWSEICGGAGGWSSKEVMQIFRDLERSDQSSSLRGHSGQLHVSTVRTPHAVTDAFVKSAHAAGYEFNEDYNGCSQEGVSYMQRSLRNGFRCSAADAFIKPLLGGEHLKLLLRASVEKIQIVDGRAVGVSFLHKGRSRQATARNIVLCAGAINSPKLLMLSGIGNSEDLTRQKITVVQDRPEVGRNLREHPVIRLVYRSKIPTYNLTEGLLQRLGILVKFLRYREGPMAVVYEGAAFVKSASSDTIPEFQLLFAPLGVLGKIGGAVRLAPYPAFMIVLLRSHPLSSGCVRLASDDPNDVPLIECRLLAEKADIEALAQGIETVRNIMSKDPIASLIEMEITPGRTIASRETLAQFIRENTEVAFHPIGTCRMGIDDDAVVGPDLRVRGIENLWVADASIMPDHISANINAACMMIGAKLGRQLSNMQ